ncbi:MAG: DUF4153 domain-containing protein [Pseudomonadota bacterium]|nr:DUF4153 domain-containing protein [Pseudomonadota bacterium]
MPESLVRPEVGARRLLIGLLQGALLYGMYRAAQDHTWPASVPMLFIPLLMVLVMAPVLLMSSLGHMAGRRVAQWIGVSVAVIAVLGVYDAWRAMPFADPDQLRLAPSPLLRVFLVAGFFIAHSLVMTGSAERRRIASYAGYFETAWKMGVQLAFSTFFVGVVWGVLNMGAELFALVKLSFLRELLQKSWFNIPMIAFAFSCAMHITDVRPAIVRGIRTLLLVLLSWILPVAVLIVGGFLASLLFTGLAPLWATRHASAVLLGAAALLVVLVNAAWQNGAALSTAAMPIRFSARIAALLLAPIVLIAIWALTLRVADHGWTNDRIIAAACELVAACYAAGYAQAALRKGWLERIGAVNILTAFVVLAVLLALFSPIADPARLSVDNQLARLMARKVAADKFDFAYLRFEGERYGKEALAKLKKSSDQAVRTGVDAALALSAPRFPNRQAAMAPRIDIAANMTVWPKGASVPPAFLATDWRNINSVGFPDCLVKANAKCDAYLIDVTDDGKPEMVVVGAARGGDAAIFGEAGADRWTMLDRLPFNVAGCAWYRQHLIDGSVRAVAPARKVLEIGGRRIASLAVDEVDEHGGCPK